MKHALFLAVRNVYYLGIKGLLLSTGYSRRAAWWAAGLLGAVRNRAGYVGRGRNRRLYLQTIREARPDLDDAGVKHTLTQFWVNHQASLLELFLSTRLSPESAERLAAYQGLEHLERATAAGGGAVVATLHMGDERLLHILLALKGFPVRVLSAAFDDYGWAARQSRLRAAGAFHPVETGSSVRWMYRSIERGEIVFIAVSGFGGRRGAWVDLMGRDILFSTAPARLALRTGAPLVPAVCLRDRLNRYRICVDAPIPLPGPKYTGEAAAYRMTRDLVRRFDRWIAVEPGQFNWMWYIIRQQETDPGIGGIRGGRTEEIAASPPPPGAAERPNDA